MGRPSKEDAGIAKTIRLSPADWQYIALYLAGDNVSAQVRETVDALRRMRPGGPNAFGHAQAKQPRQRKPYRAIQAYADERGLTRYEAEAELIKQALK